MVRADNIFHSEESNEELLSHGQTQAERSDQKALSVCVCQEVSVWEAGAERSII